VGLEHGVDVAGRPPGVVGQSHRRATEHGEVGNNATVGQAIAEPPGRICDRCPVEQRIIGPPPRGHRPLFSGRLGGGHGCGPVLPEETLRSSATRPGDKP